MRVESIMSSPAITVGTGVAIQAAIGRMLEANIGSVVVTDTGAAGILTRSDALRAAYHAGASLREIPVTKAMSDNLVTTRPNATVDSALQTMETHQIKKLPVAEDFDLVGIVTMTDIARHRPEEVEQTRRNIDRRDDWTN